jgi:signal transduction histidine kinase
MNTLRNRLFASYLAVLFIALIILTFVLLGFLQTREVPPEFTWQRLSLLLSGFTSQQFARELLQAGLGAGAITDILDNFAEENAVRVLLVAEQNERPIVLYDSAGVYNLQSSIQLQSNEPQQRPHNGPQTPPTVLTGRFVDAEGTEWLFTGFSRPPERRIGQGFDKLTLMLAEPATSESLTSAWAEFGRLFLEPILRSACISGIAAFAFAIFISRSIVRPLQALSKSAQQVAKGEYLEQLPETTGPIELRQVSSAFNRMTGEVRSTQDSQREFLANVSHDLKTPLTSIQGYSQAIIDGAAKNPADAAAIIYEEAERLNRMVTELTDLARIQAGRLSLKMTALDVGEMTSAIAERLAIVAARKNISIRAQTSPMPQIAGDGDRLVQVLTNLIGNAIKYTPNGGKIVVSTSVASGGVEIIVKDSGIGIPPDDLPRIFERFYQVDKSRGPSRGTGLGLAITNEIVQAHGGKIRIESAGVNQGTSVTVWLPSPQLSTIVSRR